jgi:hypothetical protein
MAYRDAAKISIDCSSVKPTIATFVFLIKGKIYGKQNTIICITQTMTILIFEDDDQTLPDIKDQQE